MPPPPLPPRIYNLAKAPAFLPTHTCTSASPSQPGLGNSLGPSILFNTFPLCPFGSSPSTTLSSVGNLYPASLSRRSLLSPSSDNRRPPPVVAYLVWSARSVTTAATRCPNSSSATPHTIASHTYASPSSSRSMSSAEILYPPDLMMSSEARPTIQ